MKEFISIQSFTTMTTSLSQGGIFMLGLFLCLTLFSCESDPPTPAYTPPDSSFGLVYTKIFTTSCSVSGCHDGKEQSPSLTGADTYRELISQDPANQEALQANLELIKPSVSDSSFLYQKLIFATSNFKFGSPMPQGGLSLTSNEIEFVREWIDAGAPETGHVADSTLLN